MNPTSVSVDTLLQIIGDLTVKVELQRRQLLMLQSELQRAQAPPGEPAHV
jgi:hypothetical protein